MREEYHLGGELFKRRYIDSGYMNENYTRSQVRSCDNHVTSRLY